MTSPSTSTSPPYNPAPYILSGSGLTAEQLAVHFESFKESLRYSSVAPELVFERILGNFCAAVPAPEGSQGRTGQRFSSPIPTNTTVSHTNPSATSGESATSDGQQPAPIPNDSAGRSPKLPAMVLKFKTSTGEYTRWQDLTVNSLSSSYGLYGKDSWPPQGFTVDGAQSGNYNTTPESRGIPHLSEIERSITFTTPFAKVPEVLVWFTGLDTCSGSISRVSVSIIQPRTTGFTLCIKTAGEIVLYSAGVSWLAYVSTDVNHEQFIIPTHSLCPTTGAENYQIVRGIAHNCKQAVVVVNEVVISGIFSWLRLSPTTVDSITGLIQWGMDHPGFSSGYCVLGVKLIIVN